MNDKRQQIIDLWRTCFHDPEPFINLYFKRVYQDKNTLTIEKNGHIVSALQLIPYTLIFDGQELSMMYICGVCTIPEERNQGLMKQLMDQAIEEMEKRGVVLSSLIPAEHWLFDYYRQFGYTEAFDYSENLFIVSSEEIKQTNSQIELVKHPKEYKWFNYFNQAIRRRSCCVLHTYENYITIIQDLLLDNGHIYAATDKKNEIVGMAFALPQEDEIGIHIKEILYDSTAIKEDLLQTIAQINNTTKISVYEPSSEMNIRHKGMVRILDFHHFIKCWLSQNTEPTYTLEELMKLDSRQLINLLWSRPEQRPFMSLMLD